MFKIVALSPNQNITKMIDDQLFSIKADNLELTVQPLGAQILEFKVFDENILYYDPKDIKHSGIPLCFPNFGAISEPLKINGKEYNLAQHGFFRDQKWEIEKSTNNSVTYKLTANNETLKKFPYHFIARITYSIENFSLKISAEITYPDITENKQKQMPLVFALHPYFTVKDPNTIEFTTNATTYYNNNLKENKPTFTKQNKTAEAPELFLTLENKKEIRSKIKDQPNYIYENNHYLVNGTPDHHFLDHSNNFTSLHPGTENYKIRMSWDDNFKYLTIWRPKPNVNYICLEPATGLKNDLANAINKNQEILSIEKGQTKKFQVEIKIIPEELILVS